MSQVSNRIRAVSINSVAEDGESHASGSTSTEDTLVGPLDSYNLGGPSWQLSELLQDIPKHKDNPLDVLNIANVLATLLADYPDLKEDLMLQNLINRTAFMVSSNVSEVRAIWYRILRNCVVTEDSLYILTQNKILIFLIVTLSSHNTFLEKSEALKLIYRFLIVENGSNYLSIGAIKAVMCLVDLENETFPEDISSFAIQIILEVSLLNPKLIHHAKGFTLLMNLLQDGTVTHCMSSLIVILNLMECNNQWSSSIFLKSSYSMNSIVTVFDTDYKKLPHSKLQRSCVIFTVLLKNWSGLIYLSQHNFKILSDLVQSLQKSNPKVRDYVLDIFLDILGVRVLPWLKNSTFGKFFEAGSNKDHIRFSYSSLMLQENDKNFNHFVNHYRGLLAFILIKVGLIQQLSLIIEDNFKTSDKAILLASTLHQYSKLYLPLEFDLNLPPSINLDSLIKMETIALHSVAYHHDAHEAKKWNIIKDSIKHIANEYQFVDDLELKAMINNTKVLAIKEFNDWDWTLILRVFQGPLMSEKRFNDVLEKQPKFFKRLFSFYRPFKFRFCNISVKNKNFKMIIQVGLSLFELFTTYSSGLKYFFRNKILLQMCEIFAQVDRYSGISASGHDQILYETRLNTTLSIGYLKFIGKLSETTSGLNLLSQWQFFQLFSNIIENSATKETNNFLLTALFSCVSYKMPNTKFKNLLNKLLNVCNTKLQAKIISNVLPQLFEDDEAFAVKLIINNLYLEPMTEKLIDALYAYYFDKKYEDEKFLDSIIKYNPSVNVFSKHRNGRKLLLNFFKTSAGFKYLHKLNYIEQKFKQWQNLQHDFHIARYMESQLSEKLNPSTNLFTKEEPYDFFLANILESQEGLNFFQTFNLECNFVNNLVIRIDLNHARINSESLNHSEHNQACKTLKQDLWIIGEIFASKFGMKLFDSIILTENNIFSILIDIWHNCKIWSIRGIAFYQLSNAAVNMDGIEILDELDWVVTRVDRKNRMNNYCYPRDLSLDMFELDDSNDLATAKNSYGGNSSTSGLTEQQIEIINLIHGYSSFLSRVEKNSKKELLSYKKNTDCFKSIDLFLAVVRIIDSSHFSYSKRNFILDLFLEERSMFDSLLKRRK